MQKFRFNGSGQTLKLVGIVVFSLFSGPVLAKQPPGALHRDVLSTWTTVQGLPQNFITAIDQTSDGFLWVGTLGGLARFDGQRFETFGPRLPSALHGSISAMALDANGTLWIGTASGLFFYRDGSFRSAPSWQGRPITLVEKILAANRSGAWVRTRDHLLYLTNTSAQDIVLPIAMRDMRSFAYDRQGQLWLTDGRTIVVSSDGRVQARYPLENASLVYAAPDGAIYAGDGHHLFVFHEGKFHRVANAGPGEFVSMMIDSKRRLWMASGGLEGISCKTENGVEMLTSNDGLASNDARVVFEDRSGDIWIGTISGLQRLHAGLFTSYTERDGLLRAAKQYDSIFQDQQGSIWVGAIEAGVARWDGKQWQTFGTKAGLPSGQVRGFVQSASGDRDDGPIIAISDYGLFRYHSGRFYHIPHIPAGYICSPVRASDGSLWFSVQQKAVYRMKDGVLSAYGTEQGLPDNVIWALLPDEEGGVWAAASTGLFHWRDGHWLLDVATEGSVLSVMRSSRLGLLLGTATGIIIVRDGHRWTIGQENGLPVRMVLSMVEDNNGDIWLASTNAIGVVPHQQIEAVMSGAASKISPEIFTEADGLRSPDVLPLPQVNAIRARDGHIWFATARGPAVVMPTVFQTEPPTAVLDSVAVDDQPYDYRMLAVPPGRHRITFNFTAPVFVAPEQVTFRYRLNGWDTDWVDAGTQRTASYTALPPGGYGFRVQAIARGVWRGPVSTEGALRLKPYFWQTRFARISTLLLGIALIIEFTRRRSLRRVERFRVRFEERAAERERIAYQIHDSLIQDLIGATLQLELVGLQLLSEREAAQKSLDGIASHLRATITRSRDMVSALHSTASPHYSLYDVLSLCESEFRVGHKPELRVVSMGEPREINPVVRDEIYRICREAVANAFRHAKAQMIQVKIQYEKVGLTIDIVDDGGGMDEKTNQFGRMGHFGLRGMRAHARRIGAEFSVTSVLGGGTHVRLRARIAQGWKERMQASLAAWPRPLEDFLSRIKAKVGDGFEQ